MVVGAQYQLHPRKVDGALRSGSIQKRGDISRHHHWFPREVTSYHRDISGSAVVASRNDVCFCHASKSHVVILRDWPFSLKFFW